MNKVDYNKKKGGGGPVLMIEDKDDQSGVGTGDNIKGNHLCRRLICDDGIGWGEGIRHSILSECIVT